MFDLEVWDPLTPAMPSWVNSPRIRDRIARRWKLWMPWCQILIREQHPGINGVQLGAELSLLRGVHLQRLAMLYDFGLNRRRRVGPRTLDRKLYVINPLQLDDPRLNNEQFMARLSPFLRPNIRGLKCRKRYFIARLNRELQAIS